MNLKDMQAEVVQVCHDKGWYDEPVSFSEQMALIHSEVSEALEAWRSWRLKDATERCAASLIVRPDPPKPEGVGSEFADVFIRLLDCSDRFGVDLSGEYRRQRGLFGVSMSFAENINALHMLIVRISAAQELGDEYGKHFAAVLVFLVQLCCHYDIDLEAEYARKVAYNRTRPYRHGGRTL